MKRLKVAVLISGSGRSLENLIERSRAGSPSLPIEIVLVVSSDAKAYGLERAKRHGVPSTVVSRRAHADVASFTRAIFDQVEAAQAELVVLAGFLHLIGIPDRWRGRVLNIHPALIPAFCGKGYYGEKVHAAALEAGVKVTGCTVHFCDDQYDHGPIVLQRTVPVLDGDTVETLAARVFEAEKEALPEAVRLFAEGRLTIDGRRVRTTT